MYISIRGKGPKAKVWIRKSYRENGKVKTRDIECLGSLDKLTQEDPEAIIKLKAQLNNQRLEKEVQQQACQFKRAQSIINEPKSGAFKAIELIYSNYIMRFIWKEIGLEKTIKSLQYRKYKDLNFDLNSVAFTECFSKIIDPSSILSTYSHKGDFFGAPLHGVTVKNMYSVLDILYENKDLFIRCINKNIDKIFERKNVMVFYDVTNAYIESSLTDEERKYYRDINKDKLENIFRTAIEQSLMTKDEAKSFLDSEDFDIDNLPESIRNEVRCTLFLRMRGMSKEHRFDLPIVSIALVIDENAIPIDFEIFSGCSSEMKTMTESIKKFQDRYNIKETIVVADRGLNSTSNISKLIENGYGFIVAQKVSNLKSSEKTALFSEDGYQEHYILKNNDLPAKGDNIYDIIKYKSIDYTKYDKYGNNVKCKLVFTHSKKREERDLKILEQAEKEAKKAIEKNKEIPISKRNWVELVAKDNSKKAKAENLKVSVIENRRNLAGYAGFIYHPVPNKEDDILSIKEILSSYHQLVQIEDCFRIMKYNLGLRPMYVRKEEHIQGHIMCCFIALIMLRIMQIKLKNFGNSMSIHEIIAALKNAKFTALCNNDNDDIFIKVINCCQLFKDKEFLSDEQLEKNLNKYPFKNDTDILMNCLNLEQIPSTANRDMLMKIFRVTLCQDHPLIDPIVHKWASGQHQLAAASGA